MSNSKQVLAYIEYLRKKAVKLENSLIIKYSPNEDDVNINYNQLMNLINLNESVVALEEAEQKLKEALSVIKYITEDASIDLDITERDLEL